MKGFLMTIRSLKSGMNFLTSNSSLSVTTSLISRSRSWAPFFTSMSTSAYSYSHTWTKSSSVLDQETVAKPCKDRRRCGWKIATLCLATLWWYYTATRRRSTAHDFLDLSVMLELAATACQGTLMHPRARGNTTTKESLRQVHTQTRYRHVHTFINPMAVAANPIKPPLRWFACVDSIKSLRNNSMSDEIRAVWLLEWYSLTKRSISRAANLRFS